MTNSVGQLQKSVESMQAVLSVNFSTVHDALGDVIFLQYIVSGLMCLVFLLSVFAIYFSFSSKYSSAQSLDEVKKLRHILGEVRSELSQGVVGVRHAVEILAINSKDPVPAVHIKTGDNTSASNSVGGDAENDGVKV